MKKLAEVEQARAIMNEAMDWSVMKWLTEKKRVRKLADAANEKLDNIEKEIRKKWSEDLKSAFANPADGDPELRSLSRKLKDAHDAAMQMRMTAEDTFDKAERRLSTAMAREGCQQALKGWDLHEEAIDKAEAAGSVSKR